MHFRTRSLSRYIFILMTGAAIIAMYAATSQAQGRRGPTPEWIWSTKEPKANEVVYFRKSFKVDGRVRSASLVGSCDNELTLYVNGVKVLEHKEWQSPATVDIKRHLVDGENVIAVEGRNDGGPMAGLLIQATVVGQDRKRQVIVTDGKWMASQTKSAEWEKAKFDPARSAPGAWSPAASLGKLGVSPWGMVALTGGGPGGAQATAADQVTVPKGFKVELLYSVPKEAQGSWVSMTQDPKGRLICSDQSGPLYRVTPGKDAESTIVERLSLAIGEAQGLLWAFDSLYVVVNGGAAQGSGLYRCTDANGDGELDTVKLLKKIDGGGEHGPHAVKLGPDGKLYLIAGNFTRNPTDAVSVSPHRNWAEDMLLPRNPDGGGHDPHIMAPGGWVARCEPDGKHWELVCAGLRNSYDFDINQDGECFTYDSDMEWDTGTPWYRPTRVNHVVSGAEFGWRNGTGKWPAYYPDSLGAVADIGLGSPTGVIFGTGANFPAKYQRAFFINDWTYGKIYAVHMRPVGASYTADFEIFAEAKPLPVTDIVVNTDGALYFTIGGRGVQSGLYRVTYTGSDSTAAVAATVDESAAAARKLRRELEVFHTQRSAQAVDVLWPHLNSSDRSIRYAARVALENQEPGTWLDKAFAEKRTIATIQLMLAVARSGKKELLPKVVGKLNELPWNRLTEEQTLEALRAYGLAFIRLGKPSPEEAGSVVARIDALYPAESDEVNRELCQLLVYLDAPKVVERSMALLKKAQTQQEQLQYILVLRVAKNGWTLDQRKAYFSWLQLAEAKYRGGASFKNFIIRIRQDAVGTLADGDKAALKEVIEGRVQVESGAAETTRQFVHNWQMEDLIPLLSQVDSGRSFERGRDAFQVAQCYKCHRFAGDGGATGPDLTGAGNRFSARDLLESVVAPSKVISDQYKGVVLRTLDGEVVAGRVIEETDTLLRIRVNPFAKELVEIKKADIEPGTRQPSTISEMPQGAINVLSKEEVLDLVAYLRSGGNPNEKAFKK